jgi:8-oxo-dGTP diphosphatase
MASSVQPINSGIRFFYPSEDLVIPYVFAIIVTEYQGKWLWVRHKERKTWELPAGHIEPGESPEKAAHRELYEETGALDYTMDQVVSYEGVYLGKTVFGMIFLARISRLGPLPDFEIGETKLFNGIPDDLTYPQIQPAFFNFVNPIS